MNDIIIPIRLKAGTKTAYETANEPLLYGEVAIVYDGVKPKIKVGNLAEDVFGDLPYFGGGAAIGDEVTGGTAGSVLFVDVDGKLGQSANYFRYDAEDRLFLGGATLEGRLSIKASTSNGWEYSVRIVDSNDVNLFAFRNDGYFTLGGSGINSIIDLQGSGPYSGIYSPAYSSVSNNIIRYEDYSGNTRMFLDMSSRTKGFLGINNTAPIAVIDVKAETALDTVAIFRGVAFQENNLTEWRSNSSLLARVSPLGHLFVPVVDSVLYKQNGVSGFTGMGAFTNFTISGGIITAAS